MRSILGGDDPFLRLVLSDDQLLRAEFDSLVASLRRPATPRRARPEQQRAPEK